MFAFDCPIHDRRVLVWPSAIEAIRNTPGGIEVRFHCTCGYHGVWTTGKGVAQHVRAG